MTNDTIPMKWAKDAGHYDPQRTCACCGRQTGQSFKWVEVIDGGGLVARPGSNPDTSDSGYMGFFAVGNTCAKKHFKGFTHDIGD